MRRYRFEVEFDDGRTETAEVDQRDVRAWEAEQGRSWLSSDLTVTAMAQLAHAGMRRAGRFTGGWADFDAHAVWVGEVEAAEPVDPTLPAATGERSSASPSAPASESGSGRKPARPRS
jgi:hypothetical protein